MYDRSNESEQHQARRNAIHRNQRLKLGVSHVSEEYWNKLDDEISSMFESEEQQAQIEETETETIQEPENQKISVFSISEDLIKETLKEGIERTNNIIANKKIKLLNQIETVITEKEQQLNDEIAEVESQKNELKKLYERAQVEFINDRKAERERYAKELDSWFSKVYNTILNFADSSTEQTLICLYNKNVGSSIVSLSGILSSKKLITKDEIKISGGD
jgi:anion-transporting  ArsA/GET3 family ATPase